MDDLIRRSDAIKSVLGITMLQGRVPIDTVIFQINSIPVAEPCKDAISRAWLLNELEEMNVANFYELNEHSNEMYGQMKRMIKAAPSVTVESKQGEWIPCEERLPEENGYYLTFMDCGSCEVLHWYNGWNCYPCASENEIEDDVLAWMPLPKPWKGADDETD